MDVSEILVDPAAGVGVNTYVVLGVIFVIFSMICLNLVNIYYVSAGWEMIIPRSWGPKEYAIIGLLGTAAYTFFQTAGPMEFLENMAANSIASLGVSLIIVFIARTILRRRSNLHEKLINMTCWLIGCTTAILIQIHVKNDIQPFIAGISASLVAFLCVILLEETSWSIKHLFFKKE